MLSAYLIPFVRAFIFQIVNQDLQLTNFLVSIGGSFIANNGWTITAEKAPEVNILTKTIWLRGWDNEQDLRIHRNWNLSNELEKERFIAEINSALQEFVNATTALPKGYNVSVDHIAVSASSQKRPAGNVPTYKKIVRA